MRIPNRKEIIAFIRSEVARQTTSEDFADSGLELLWLQDVAVGPSQCESGVSQFYGKGVTLEGGSMDGIPVVHIRSDAIAWANVVGCIQISTYWWCRSLEEGVHLAWDYKYNVYKGVFEIVKHLRSLRRDARGDDLLKRICDRFSRGDWERMQRYPAEPEKWLR